VIASQTQEYWCALGTMSILPQTRYQNRVKSHPSWSDIQIHRNAGRNMQARPLQHDAGIRVTDSTTTDEAVTLIAQAPPLRGQATAACADPAVCPRQEWAMNSSRSGKHQPATGPTQRFLHALRFRSAGTCQGSRRNGVYPQQTTYRNSAPPGEEARPCPTGPGHRPCALKPAGCPNEDTGPVQPLSSKDVQAAPRPGLTFCPRTAPCQRAARHQRLSRINDGFPASHYQQCRFTDIRFTLW